MVESNKEKRLFLFQLSTDAQTLVAQGKKDEALACYNNILKKYPQEISAIYRKGMVHYEFGELPQALAYFDEVLKINPDEVDSLYAKGAILSHLGKNEEAMMFLDKTIQIDPKMYFAWLAKGYIYFEMLDYGSALNCFTKVEELGYKTEVASGKGHALRKLGNTKEAKAVFEQVLKNDPYDAEALFGLGMLEKDANNIKKAQDYLYKSVVQDEKNIEAWETLAEIFNQLRDFKREHTAREKVKELRKL